MSFFNLDREAVARVRDAIRRADLAMRERELKKKARKHWIKKAKKQAGGPCRSMTRRGLPCARKAYANGFCPTHGGLNVGALWAILEGQ
jgi:hypothetical protein